MNTLRPLLFAACAVLCGTLLARANPDRAAEPLMAALGYIEQQEVLVASARATFAVKHLPTTPEEKRRLQLYFRSQGQDPYNAEPMILAPQNANREDYQSVWYRKGEKEREEQAMVARPARTTTIVYDGETIKTLDNTPRRANMTIEPPSKWFNKMRVQPYYLAFEFCTLTHGELIRQSKERRFSVVDNPTGMPADEILFSYPFDSHLHLKLTYDENRRLLIRDALSTSQRTDSTPMRRHFTPPENKPGMWLRHEFMGHKPYDDGEGHTIWFPSTAILRTYIGALPDGSPVQGSAIQVDVTSIEFNLDIPDEKFRLKVPEGTPVNDLTLRNLPPR